MGFFSWKTSDTNRSIANNYSDRETFTVHLVTRCGQIFTENDYGGYGKFADVDFFELVAKLNGKTERSTGVSLVHGTSYVTNGEIKYYSQHRDFFNWARDIVHAGKTANQLLEMGWTMGLHKPKVKLPKLVEKLPDSISPSHDREKWEKWFDALPNSEDCEYQGYFYEISEEEE